MVGYDRVRSIRRAGFPTAPVRRQQMRPPPEDAKLIEYSFEVEKLAAHRKRLVIETLASMSIEGIRQLVAEIEKELGDEAVR